jgi:ribonuclease HII|tara:strand:- start:138 stop:746 length:609 start_codon:yes stop_codon:yes gene_type:complete
MLEKKYQHTIGIDEVGRGPLAGPVMAGAVLLYKVSRLDTAILQELRDSKKLTAAKREEFYDSLTNHPNIIWGIGEASEKVIDRINIFEATKLAMVRAIEALKKKLDKDIKIDNIVIDGRMSLDIDIPQLSIAKADEKILSCSIASIIAKVKRDRLMDKYHALYPDYGFKTHKGYGTKQHMDALSKYGPCDIHRKSFYPVSTL